MWRLVEEKEGKRDAKVGKICYGCLFLAWISEREGGEKGRRKGKVNSQMSPNGGVKEKMRERRDGKVDERI